MKILVAQSPNFSPAAPQWTGAEKVELGKISAALNAQTNTILLAPTALRTDQAIHGLQDAGFPLTCLFFHDQAQADQFAPSLDFLLTETRTTGVKTCLEKGSTIFSETFFNASKVGERLDSVFRFARKTLDPKRAVEAWGTLNSLLFLGIRSLPEQGEKGTGERVDVQLGADAKRLVFSVRFDLSPDRLPELRRHALLELPRTAVDFFEFRYLQDAKKAEIIGVCFLSGSPSNSIEAFSFHPAAAMESAGDAKDYTYQTFGSLHGSGPEEKRTIKGGGFKKKFSEKVATESPTETAPAAIKATPEQVIDAEAGNFLVKGEVLNPEAKVVVSGDAQLKKKDADKGQGALDSKILILEASIRTKDEQILKLSKEIEEIKDPSKMGVISNIKDNQLDGLKSNIARLEGELVESAKREKELMGVVDKAIQMKDEAIKKFKELDTKLRQSQGGNNSKITTLERQLEEQKRQNKELSGRVSKLTEQILSLGKKVAA